MTDESIFPSQEITNSPVENFSEYNLLKRVLAPDLLLQLNNLLDDIEQSQKKMVIEKIEDILNLFILEEINDFLGDRATQFSQQIKQFPEESEATIRKYFGDTLVIRLVEKASQKFKNKTLLDISRVVEQVGKQATNHPAATEAVTS
jgi:hypothetical protein